MQIFLCIASFQSFQIKIPCLYIFLRRHSWMRPIKQHFPVKFCPHYSLFSDFTKNIGGDDTPAVSQRPSLLWASVWFRCDFRLCGAVRGADGGENCPRCWLSGLLLLQIWPGQSSTSFASHCFHLSVRLFNWVLWGSGSWHPSLIYTSIKSAQRQRSQLIVL